MRLADAHINKRARSRVETFVPMTLSRNDRKTEITQKQSTKKRNTIKYITKHQCQVLKLLYCGHALSHLSFSSSNINMKSMKTFIFLFYSWKNTKIDAVIFFLDTYHICFDIFSLPAVIMRIAQSQLINNHCFRWLAMNAADFKLFPYGLCRRGSLGHIVNVYSLPSVVFINGFDLSALCVASVLSGSLVLKGIGIAALHRYYYIY